jgi:hypothetical protein
MVTSLGFNIEFADLCSDNGQERTNIVCYPYRMLKPYLKTVKTSPTYMHRRANLRGEMYENLIYERLLAWATNENKVSEFILKGPYVNPDPKQGEGLVYNSRNQIMYMSSGETVAEFDVLLTFDGCRYFVEITDTENKPLIEELAKDSLRKFNLMKILFPGERLGYWIITTYQKKIDLGGLPNVVISRTPKCNLDPDILRGVGKPDACLTPVLGKFKTVHQIKHHSFDYLAVMKLMQNEVLGIPPASAKGRLLELITPYIGLIERVFLGKLSIPDFIYLLQKYCQPSLVKTIDIDHVILALKIKAPPLVNSIAYVISSRKRLYEIDIANSKIKSIESRKRTTRDIEHFDKGLNQLSLQAATEYILSSITEK